ncbi:arginine repressor [Bifidobacterium crudilactis]|uniref:Arginine repressor n=1 Tax=Bifidobacterium crudilactis TaxID=327277 RepID=A0A971D0Y0_9BIFI|nr:arginine repressor [Bifidobacterium crudilactis]MCI1868016.1 arginine repressor [Bifidobacterium crudilactis]MDN5971568.1 arginine repressor [Bifidobacterium crudilactis]MDN6001574.1 arginine repressor [Bifidobacterium crudilactis]MDN6209683.1 arginine repressor [Bifidobacterium crudilactis]MDN6234335.1 arginine repressor [Bifidobacterium crudilactis]
MVSGESSMPLQRPTTRAARHSAIQDVLAQHIITSQQQLADVLASQNIEVTQATLSRDLDEMHATKIRIADGSVCYTVPGLQHEVALNTRISQETAQDHEDGMQNWTAMSKFEQQMSRVLSGLVTSVASAQNLVVVHTPSGAAQYVASVLDRQPIDGILGTIAGDDTVMAITSDNDTAIQRASWLLNLASGGDGPHTKGENG